MIRSLPVLTLVLKIDVALLLVLAAQRAVEHKSDRGERVGCLVPSCSLATESASGRSPRDRPMWSPRNGGLAKFEQRAGHNSEQHRSLAVSAGWTRQVICRTWFPITGGWRMPGFFRI